MLTHTHTHSLKRGLATHDMSARMCVCVCVFIFCVRVRVFRIVWNRRTQSHPSAKSCATVRAAGVSVRVCGYLTKIPVPSSTFS